MTWPLEGRPIGTNMQQGGIVDGIDFWRSHDGCSDDSSVRTESVGEQELVCEAWSCDAGGVELCLHTGGHSARDGWGARQAHWFETFLP